MIYFNYITQAFKDYKNGEIINVYEKDETYYHLENTNWDYFFKNLSEIVFLKNAWATSQVRTWRIYLLFDVKTGGSVSVDNTGN